MNLPAILYLLGEYKVKRDQQSENTQSFGHSKGEHEFFVQQFGSAWVTANGFVVRAENFTQSHGYTCEREQSNSASQNFYTFEIHNYFLFLMVDVNGNLFFIGGLV